MQGESATAGEARPKHEHLAIYLNDHLAGSEILSRLLERLQHTRANQELQPFATRLRDDVLSDRSMLESLMHRAQIGKRRRRTALGWLGEKLSRPKLRPDDPLDLLQAVEIVEIGIEGKRELWRALAASPDLASLFGGFNFDELLKRAEEQHERVEAVRLGAARTALVNGQPA